MQSPSTCSVSESDTCFPQCDAGQYFQSSYDSRTTDETSEILSRVYRPHGTLARTLYYKYLADERLQRYDRNKWYECDTSGIPDSIRDRFLPLSLDKETELFLDQSCHKSDWIFTQLWHSIAKAFLGWFMTQTSINGLLGRGSMFVFSLEQFRRLLAVEEDWRGDTLLDLGAGDGKTTEVMAPLFNSVYVTEISGPMRWILAKRGFQLLDVESWSEAGITFDVITCLNLLDRCDRPLTLLRELRAALSPGGKVVVALVLPFNPYVEIGRLDHRPTEWLPIQGSSFEEQVSSAISNVFEASGFKVEHWSRVPYLCEGDLNQAFYWLDDAVFVLSASEEIPQDVS
ncbi:protein-L-histidine N-pros-methyltransferase [Periplaneta americana]|uniref:protein-L-histidine N-pros-methyltransferase n=1 Tax=Periplaneta americana TaxID=6978 RepID=UPI0037E7A3C0